MKTKSILILILLNIIVSCTDDSIRNQAGILPDNKVRLQLKLDTGDYTRPVTRNAENVMGDHVWVLVFDGTQKENADFKEMAKASISDDDLFVTLTKSTAHSHVLVIANIPDNYYNKDKDAEDAFNQENIINALTGKTLSYCQDILYTTFLAQPAVATIPYTTQSIPMAGIAEVPGGITESTVLSNTDTNKLQLTRIVAKTGVSNISEDFELLRTILINAPRQGSFLHLTTTDIDTSVTQLTDYPETTPTPVYLYESAVENKTALIIKGKYKGAEYYYKLGFVDPSGNSMPIQRNKYYKFQITAITGPGKSSFDDARIEAPQNISYSIEVLDDTSHDIISNGKYYLGVSNSELHVYGEGAQSGIIALTVNTDATTAMGITTNLVTAEGTGLTVTHPVNSINLATSSQPGSTDIKIALAPHFESGAIHINLGDLAKTVKISRRKPLSYTGVEVIYGSYVSAVITERGIGEQWLSLSGDGITSSHEEIILQTPGPVYIMAPSHITSNSGTNRNGGEFFLVGNNDAGRIKFLISQTCLNTSEITIDPFGYVGAFWRKNQTGERLIRIPHKEGTEGAWSAFVLSGEEWIKLDTEQSADPNIGWKPGSNESAVADMNTASNDTHYKVSGTATSLSGTLKKDGFIYFRIGLKSTYTSTHPARYGVVLLSYNDNQKFSKIFIRQGEDADYVMRPDASRPLAKEFTVYNTTSADMQMVNTYPGGSEHHLHPHINGESGVFTKYPTQIGAYLQYANKYNQRFAYHPVNPLGKINGWQNNYIAGFWEGNLIYSYESCPKNYRRPNDGSTSTGVGIGSNDQNSEMRQSLYAISPVGLAPSTSNAYFGYYADGFFDRRKIVSSPTGIPSCAVSTGDYQIAYAGYLFFNPSDNASLFFPVGGQRTGTDGRLQSTGTYGAYWSVTAYSDPDYAWALTFNNHTAGQIYIRKSEAVSIRCVKK